MMGALGGDPAPVLLRVVVATGNPGKAREFARLLGADFSVEALPPIIDLPEETGDTFGENARLKALSASASLGGAVAVLADDSGLEVAALGGAPGVRSARYAGEEATDQANVELLLARLDGVADRAGRFVCALAMVIPAAGDEAQLIIEACGTLEGRIAPRPRGEQGFGYDPVFVPEGWSESLGEADPVLKDSVSHRGRAVAALVSALAREGIVSGG